MSRFVCLEKSKNGPSSLREATMCTGEKIRGAPRSAARKAYYGLNLGGNSSSLIPPAPGKSMPLARAEISEMKCDDEDGPQHMM